MARLKDKIVIVTGGARGIGAAFSKAVAEQGAVVIVADVLDGGRTVEEIEAAGGRAAYYRVDVADAASVNGVVEQALSRYDRIDGLVNNAALFANLKPKPFFEIDDAEFDKVTDPAEIASWGVMATPALVIDDEVVLSGRVPSSQDLAALLRGS